MRMTFSAIDEPNLGPQLRRQPTAFERPIHRLDPSGHQAASDALTNATLYYRRTMHRMSDAEAGFMLRFAWQARAELYRRIASHQQIID
jgi:hypothetical protein